MIVSHWKQITCILPQGLGGTLLERLRVEFGIDSALCHHARGVDAAWLHQHNVYAAEKDIVVVLAAPEQADAVFHWLFRQAGLDKPAAGMVWVEHVRQAVPLRLPPDGSALADSSALGDSSSVADSSDRGGAVAGLAEAATSEGR